MITNNTIQQAFKGSWHIGNKTFEGNPLKDGFVKTALESICLRTGKLLDSDIAVLKTAFRQSTGKEGVIQDIQEQLEGGKVTKTNKGYTITIANESTPIIEFIA